MKNFSIQPKGKISSLFLERNAKDLISAADLICHLPYERNQNKKDLASVFVENRGTCSTKHAVLKQLAIENNIEGIKLMMGMFKMNSRNTPAIGDVLAKHGLEYIPEAHNYLSIDDKVLDCTKPSFSANHFLDDLIEETEIEPHQINEHKVNYHKEFLRKWLKDQPHLKFSFEELWEIREECIKALSDKSITKQAI